MQEYDDPDKPSTGQGGGGYGDRGSRPMHKAVCSDCGKECEVPFQPTEGRPVYCDECFKKHRPPRRGGGGGGGFRRRNDY